MTRKARLNAFFMTKIVRYKANHSITTPFVSEIVIKLSAILLIPD